jgi:hypothetical protein
MSFSNGTYVDITRGLGHEAGERFCVAPVVGETPMSAVGYWAVGRECCEQRGLFSCGNNLTNPHARDGVVLMGGPGQDLDIFSNAVEQAAAVYGIPLPQNNVRPILMFWNQDFEIFTEQIYSDAMTFCIVAILAFLAMVPVYSVTLSLLGLSLFERPDSAEWHTDMVDLMTIGLDLKERDYPKEFETEMLQMRCYFSGEVMYDYAFYLANRHFFLGCLLAHPAHPFSKRERIIVTLIIMPLVVFPMAAWSSSFGETGTARTLFILFIVIVPRNLLNYYLKGIATEDSVKVLEEGFLDKSEEAQRAQNMEAGLMALCGAVTIVVCVLSCFYIRSHSTEPVGDVLLQNADGLGYIFVLDILVDIFWPKELKGRFLLGFFHRWRVERDQEEGLSSSKKKRQQSYKAPKEPKVH